MKTTTYIITDTTTGETFSGDAFDVHDWLLDLFAGAPEDARIETFALVGELARKLGGPTLSESVGELASALALDVRIA